MKSRGGVGGLLLVGLSMVGVACTGAMASPQPADAEKRELSGRGYNDDVDAAMWRLLRTTKLDADYDGVDFSKVIDDLRKRAQINMVANWAALSAAGINRDRRVEIHLKQVPLTTLLDNILTMVGGETSLGYVPIDGILVISSKEDLDRRTLLRVYDVTDLLGSQFELRRFANTPILRLQLAGGESTGGSRVIERVIAPNDKAKGQGGGGTGGGGIFGGGGSRAAEPAAVAAQFVDVDSVIELIEEIVDPESWRHSGGNVGSIRPFGGSLLVTQTALAHQQIEELLRVLRENRVMPLDAEAVIVKLSGMDAGKWRGAVGAGFPRLSAEQVRTAVSGGTGAVAFKGTTSGHNGQRMWFSALTQRTVIGSYSPIVGNGTWAALPELVTVNEGLELIALPLVAPDDGSLALDVQMAWAPPAELKERTVTLGPAGAVVSHEGAAPSGGPATATVEMSSRRMRTVSTSVRLKLGEGIALSIPDMADGAGAKGEEDWLILQVRKTGK